MVVSTHTQSKILSHYFYIDGSGAPAVRTLILDCMDLRFSDLLDSLNDSSIPSPEFYQDFRKSRRIILNVYSQESAFPTIEDRQVGENEPRVAYDPLQK
jgi:hypothetical protein